MLKGRNNGEKYATFQVDHSKKRGLKNNLKGMKEFNEKLKLWKWMPWVVVLSGAATALYGIIAAVLDDPLLLPGDLPGFGVILGVVAIVIGALIIFAGFKIRKRSRLWLNIAFFIAVFDTITQMNEFGFDSAIVMRIIFVLLLGFMWYELKLEKKLKKSK